MALACPFAAAEQLPLRLYTTTDGLAHNNVVRIVRDSRGFLWFCTAEGLSLFDGYAFVSFGAAEGLPHPRVNDVLETRNGEYWVATEAGIARFDPRGWPQNAGGRRKRAMFVPVAAPEGGARANAATVLHEAEDGTIWVGTQDGLFRLRRGSQAELERVDVGIPHSPPESRTVRDILEVQGSLWIASTAGLVRRRADGTALLFTVADGLPGDDVTDLFQDRDGRLWAATRMTGFFEFSARTVPGSRLVVGETYSTPALPSAAVFQLYETSDGRFWAGTTLGLAELVRSRDGGHPTFRTHSVANGLSAPDIVGLTEDAGGNLWLATNRAGVMRLARNGFTSYRDRDGIAEITSIFGGGRDSLCVRGSRPPSGSEDPGNLALYGCLDGPTFHWFSPAAIGGDGWAGERITIRTHIGEWWIGTGMGLYRFAAGKGFLDLERAKPVAVYTPEHGLASPQVFRLFEDSGGNVWISSKGGLTNGLARWEIATGRVRDLAHSEGLPSLEEELPRAFAEDHDRQVWIGFNGGLARYANGAFAYYTAREGLPPGSIMDIHVDTAGRVWLASSESGLVRVDGAAAAQPVFTAHTTVQGFSSNRAEVIAEDLRGHLYVGSERGLDRFDPATGRLKHFSIADGLPTGSFRTAYRDDDDVLWFGMSKGLARLAPPIDKPSAPPSVLIRGVRVGGVPRAVSAIGELEVALPDGSSGRDAVEIDYGGFDFRVGEALRYQYRLEGAKESWSEPSIQRTVRFSSLRPGSYRFVVQAVNADGTVSAQAAGVSFTILPPFWRRWWFLSLLALAAAGVLHSAYGDRLGGLVEVAQLRMRRAVRRKDVRSTPAARRALLAEAAKGSAGVAVSGQRGSSDLDLHPPGSTSEALPAINPAHETLLDLARRLRLHAEEIFTPRGGIDLHFHATGIREGVRLGIDVRRDLLRVFSEAVNNAARHSKCTRIDIQLTLEGAHLSLIVCDNGRGFDTSRSSRERGLASMARRARRLGGTFEIVSAPGSGTVVRMDVVV